MGILARLRLAKIRTMARPNSPDMPPKRTKKVRLGINIAQFLFQIFPFMFKKTSFFEKYSAFKFQGFQKPEVTLLCAFDSCETGPSFSLW